MSGKLISPGFEDQLNATVRKVQSLTGAGLMPGKSLNVGTQLWLAKAVTAIPHGGTGNVKLVAGSSKGSESIILQTLTVYNRWEALAADDWCYVGLLGGGNTLEVVQMPVPSQAVTAGCPCVDPSVARLMIEGAPHAHKYRFTVTLQGSLVTFVCQWTSGNTFVSLPMEVESCYSGVHEVTATLTIVKPAEQIAGRDYLQATIHLVTTTKDGSCAQDDVDAYLLCPLWRPRVPSKFHPEDETTPTNLFSKDDQCGVCVEPYSTVISLTFCSEKILVYLPGSLNFQREVTVSGAGNCVGGTSWKTYDSSVNAKLASVKNLEVDLSGFSGLSLGCGAYDSGDVTDLNEAVGPFTSDNGGADLGNSSMVVASASAQFRLKLNLTSGVPSSLQVIGGTNQSIAFFSSFGSGSFVNSQTHTYAIGSLAGYSAADPLVFDLRYISFSGGGASSGTQDCPTGTPVTSSLSASWDGYP